MLYSKSITMRIKMTNITYRFLNGNEVGQWPGKGYRDDKGRCRRVGQIFLGKVINK